MVGRPFPVRIALLGVALVVAGVAFGVPRTLFLAPFVAALALVAFFVRRKWRPVPLVLLAVLVFPFLLFGVTEGELGFSLIDSFSFFLPSFYGTVGALLVVIGCVWALVGRARGTLRPGGRGLKRAFLWSLVTALAGVSVVSVALTLTTESIVPLRERLGAVPVKVGDNYFRPTAVRMRKGDRIYLRNDGNDLHTFTLDEPDIDWVLAPGREKVFRVDGRPGKYRYYCRVSGHDDQRGTLSLA